MTIPPNKNPDLQRLDLPKWNVGDDITAQRLQGMNEAIMAGQVGANAPRQVTYGPSYPIIQQFIFSGSGSYAASADGYLICYEFNNGVQGSTAINVALPYMLRSSTWNGYTDSNGVAYASTGLQTMTATRSSDSTVENWKIVFPYESGDLIMAVANVRGGNDATDSAGNALKWCDLNIDGRAWAKV